MSSNIDLAGRLKKLRKACGWTQQRLAHEARVAYMVVARIEQGLSREPTIVSMVKIADALGVSLDELIGRTLPRPKK